MERGATDQMPGKNNKEMNELEQKDCVHVFLIDPPNGKYSKGTCRECGLEKKFSNSPNKFFNYGWGEEKDVQKMSRSRRKRRSPH